MIKYSISEIKKRTLKPINGFIQVLITDKLGVPLVWLLANFTNITPNQVSLIALIFIFLSGYWFASGHIYLGILGFFLSFFIDSVDGKMARLKNCYTKIGVLIEGTGDQLRIFVPMIGLAYGYYGITKDVSIFLWAMTAMFSNLLFDFTGLFTLFKTKLADENPKFEKFGETDFKGDLAKKEGVDRIRNWLNKKRLELQICATEQEWVMFILFPLLSYFKIEMIKYGLILGIVLIFLWLGYKNFVFYKRFRNVYYKKKGD